MEADKMLHVFGQTQMIRNLRYLASNSTFIPTISPSPSPKHFLIKTQMLLIALAVIVGVPLFTLLLQKLGFFQEFAENISLSAREAMDTKDMEYSHFLLLKKRYTGVKPWLYPHGTYLFNVGAYEDFLRLMCNEHFIFAMLLADKIHPYSRWKRRVSYFCSTSITFLLNTLLTIAGVNDKHVNHFVVSFLIIGPIVLAFDQLLYLFVVCPCFVKSWAVVRYTTWLGSVFVQIIFLIIGIICFILAVIFSSTFVESGIHFIVERLVLGLFVYPLLIKLVAFYLPYVRCTFGLSTCCCYLSIFGGWNVDKKIDLKADEKHKNLVHIELGQLALLAA